MIVLALDSHHFYRPELIWNHPTALNPDSCSPFIWKDDKQSDSDEISKATQNLRRKIIPAFAADLDRGLLSTMKDTRAESTTSAARFSFSWLVSEAHRKGIVFLTVH